MTTIAAVPTIQDLLEAETVILSKTVAERVAIKALRNVQEDQGFEELLGCASREVPYEFAEIAGRLVKTIEELQRVVSKAHRVLADA
jgi:CRP-like cAMP-binding protein